MQRVIRLEHALVEGFRHVEEKLSPGQETFQLFSDGLRAYKDRLLKEAHVSDSYITLRQLTERIRTDKELRFPHKKILDFLLGEFDPLKSEFREVHFLKLAREARIGKNMASGYLSLLEEKGYVSKRHDGYRKFFKIRR